MRMFVLLGALALSSPAAAQQKTTFDLSLAPRVVKNTCVVGPRGAVRCTSVTTPAAASVGWTGPRGNAFAVTFGGVPSAPPPMRRPRPRPVQVEPALLLVPVQRPAVVVTPQRSRAQRPCPNARRSAMPRARPVTVRR